jgi:uroporphyrinogen decarboxylase
MELDINLPVKETFLGRKIESMKDEVDFWYEAGYDHYPHFLHPFPGIENAHGVTESVHTREGRYSVYGDGPSTRGWVEEGKGVIDSWESFEKYAWIKVEDVDFARLEEAAEVLPDGMAIVPVYGCILNSSQWLMGLENFCLKMYDEPDLVAAVIERVGELIYSTLRAAADMDRVGAIWYGDDLGYTTGLFAPPAFLREHVFPCMRKIGDVCRDKDIPFIFHSDGDVNDIMGDIIACGVNCLHPIEPKPMDIVQLKSEYGDRLALAGNIDLSYTLTLGPPEGVEAEVRERIRMVGPGGGYCVGSSNAVPDYVPIENFCAMIDATFEYGKYPLELD